MSEPRTPSASDRSSASDSGGHPPAADAPENADALMPSGPGMSIWTLLIVSVVLHAVILGVTSAGFLLEVNEYGTWRPDRAKAELAEQEREEQAAAERERAQAERSDRERDASQQAAGESERREEAQRDRPDTLENAADSENGQEQSPVEEEVTETSDERPTDTSLGGEDPSQW